MVLVCWRSKKQQKRTRTDDLNTKGDMKKLGINMEKVNPTEDSCSVVDALPTSSSRSGTPFPRGLWGCTLPPASQFPELL